jgi:uncharacterized protein with FMN-binding domain
MMDQTPTGQNKKIIAIVGLLVIVAVVGIGAAVTSGKQTAHEAPTPTVLADSASASPDASASPATAGSYKDGTYSATGSYQSPGGTEAIKITVTLAGGVIKDTSAVSQAIDDDGSRYQSMFINGYKSQVVGKSIDSVRLSRVSGSSLTSQGFNSAISKIKTTAKS